MILLNEVLDKKDKLFLILFSRAKIFGKTYLIQTQSHELTLISQDRDEITGLFNLCIKEKLILQQQSTSPNNLTYQITLDGLHYYQKITSEGENSRNCFIAMSFDPTFRWIYKDCIEPVLNSLKYKPLKVDEEDTISTFNPEHSINEEIVLQIKKSKFIIADFTQNRAGVYFESGYALGKGKRVIYTCYEDESANNIHFDTNHFPIIFYKHLDEFRQKLTTAIEQRIIYS